MFQALIKVVDRINKVREAARKACIDNLFHAAAGIRKHAQASIQNSPTASAPGTPPHSRRGLIRNAIVFDVDKKNLSAVIGPRGSRVGTAASAHEFGGHYKQQDYPARPFMGPAMEKRAPQFAGSFAGSIGE